jgi:hypothetical protein
LEAILRLHSIARPVRADPQTRRTVTTHLSNVYRKLSIGSRGELVDRVREGRLRAASDDD